MFETTELDFNNLKDSANKSENSKDPTGKSLKNCGLLWNSIKLVQNGLF